MDLWLEHTSSSSWPSSDFIACVQSLMVYSSMKNTLLLKVLMIQMKGKPVCAFAFNALNFLPVTKQSQILWPCRIRSNRSKRWSSHTSGFPRTTSVGYRHWSPWLRRAGESTDSSQACYGRCIEVCYRCLQIDPAKLFPQERILRRHWNH